MKIDDDVMRLRPRLGRGDGGWHLRPRFAHLCARRSVGLCVPTAFRAVPGVTFLRCRGWLPPGFPRHLRSGG
jgi:hypothetical protein